MWKEHLFKPLFLLVTRTCLKLIKMQRYQHSSIDAQSIRNILRLYSKPAFLSCSFNAQKFIIVDPNFNEMIKMGPFLRDTEEFYHHQTILSLESTLLLEYLTQASFYKKNPLLLYPSIIVSKIF
jgi:hypothetical protein